MKRSLLTLSGLLSVVLLCACGGEPPGEQATAEAPGAEAVTTEAESRSSVAVAIPLGTEVEAAAQHFLAGQRDLDMARNASAREHFALAIEADASMALAHLRAAQIASSFDGYRTHLEHAEEGAATADDPVRLMVMVERAGFDGNREQQLSAARELVRMAPESPRAWILLGNVQTGFNQVDDARQSYMQAVTVSPEFTGGHLALANSLILRTPLDPVAAQEHASHAIDLEPGEALPQDILGDALRAAGDLEGARAAYARSAELDPSSGLALQQLGHVNSFLGEYDQARANYDEAVALAQGNQRATFRQWRAFVHLHEGNAQAAIDELNELVTAIDAMGVPEPVGVKIGSLGLIAGIALHRGYLAQAEAAVNQRTDLQRLQIAETGTDEFRRAAESNIAFWRGLVAAYGGDYASADGYAQEIMTLMEPDNDPRKFEAAHDLMGTSSMLQSDWGGALGHLEQGNTNNVYNQFQRARAHEELGDADAARTLFQGIVDNRFNNVNTALLRGEAMAHIT